MTDIFDPAKRSEIMSRIKSKGSEAEKIVFSELRKRRIYFQSHYKNAPGKPDIALPRRKIAVFIDGDFWHGRDIARIASSRPADDYWVKKLNYNVERDRSQSIELAKRGWKVLRIWESDIKKKSTRDESLQKIVGFLSHTKKDKV